MCVWESERGRGHSWGETEIGEGPEGREWTGQGCAAVCEGGWGWICQSMDAELKRLTECL